MPSSSRRLMTAGVAAVLSVAAVATGCASTAPRGARGTVDVVASTNVWGSVASAVGGDRVAVSSVIDQADQDPHSFEASARTLLEVRDADLLVENGGGYDDFMRQMIDGSGATAPVVDAVSVSGEITPPGGQLNEHVWYDLGAVRRVAAAIARQLERLDHRHADEYRANLAAFDAQVDVLRGRVAAVRSAYAGTGVAITEPVPGYLLADMGLHNRTPAEFSDSIEESGDVSPRSLAETLDLFSERQVSLLVYNAQTTGPVTVEVEAAAHDAGVPVVPVTETLPAGTTYLGWMGRTISRIQNALVAG